MVCLAILAGRVGTLMATAFVWNGLKDLTSLAVAGAVAAEPQGPRRPRARPHAQARRDRPARGRQDRVHHRSRRTTCCSRASCRSWPRCRRAGCSARACCRTCAGDLPRFPFEQARAALAAAEPHWPAATERLSALRLQLRFAVKGALRRRLGEHRLLNVQIIDYPGEWLLDLPLLEQSYAAWSAATLAAAEAPARAALARDWRNFIATLDLDAPAVDGQARAGGGALHRLSAPLPGRRARPPAARPLHHAGRSGRQRAAGLLPAAAGRRGPRQPARSTCASATSAI